MKRIFVLCAPGLAVAAWLAPSLAWAQSAVSCSLVAPSFSGTYVDTADLSQQGTFTVNCTRTSKGKLTVNLRLSLSQAAVGQTMSTSYPDTLAYNIYRDAAYTYLWTTGPEAATGATAVESSVVFTGNTSAASTTFTAYQRIPLGQVGKAAGNYASNLTGTLEEINGAGGAVLQTLATATVSSQATVAKGCSFGAVIPSYALTYQAFRATDLTDTTKSIDVTCTKGTSYTMALDKMIDVVPTVGLTYSLVFTSTGNTSVSSVSSSGTAAASHGLTLNLPAAQAGSCATGTCNGTSVRTITVTY